MLWVFKISFLFFSKGWIPISYIFLSDSFELWDEIRVCLDSRLILRSCLFGWTSHSYLWFKDRKAVVEKIDFDLYFSKLSFSFTPFGWGILLGVISPLSCLLLIFYLESILKSDSFFLFSNIFSISFFLLKLNLMDSWDLLFECSSDPCELRWALDLRLKIFIFGYILAESKVEIADKSLISPSISLRSCLSLEISSFVLIFSLSWAFFSFSLRPFSYTLM